MRGSATLKNSAKLTVNGATLVNTKVDAFAYACVGETFREPTVVLNEGETVLWFADADFTIPFDFTKTIENTDDVTIYAAILKEGQTLEDLKNGSLSTETSSQTQTPEETTNQNNTQNENSENHVEVITIVIVALAIVGIAAAIFSIALVLKKKSL